VNLFLYGVKDLKAGAFTTPPFGALSRGVAIRMFSSACQNQESDLGKYPADFELWELGSFDQGNGSLVSEPVALGLGTSYAERSA